MTINYDYEDSGTGVAMGRGTLAGLNYALSDRFVLRMRYDIENADSCAPRTSRA